MEILRFVFSSFWVWLGTLIFVAITLQATVSALVLVVKAARPKRRRLKSVTRFVRQYESNKPPQFPAEIETGSANND